MGIVLEQFSIYHDLPNGLPDVDDELMPLAFSIAAQLIDRLGKEIAYAGYQQGLFPDCLGNAGGGGRQGVLFAACVFQPGADFAVVRVNHADVPHEASHNRTGLAFAVMRCTQQPAALDVFIVKPADFQVAHLGLPRQGAGKCTGGFLIADLTGRHGVYHGFENNLVQTAMAPRIRMPDRHRAVQSGPALEEKVRHVSRQALFKGQSQPGFLG
jgi:hypothetical protein